MTDTHHDSHGLADDPRIPPPSIVDSLDEHGTRWSTRVRIHLDSVDISSGPTHRVVGEVTPEDGRRLWHDLGVTLDTIDAREDTP